MRLATVRGEGALHVAVLAELADGPTWVAVAGAALELLGDERCPDSLTGLLLRDGPRLATAMAVAGRLRGASAPGNVQRWRPAEVRFAPPVPRPGAFLDFYAFEGHVRASRARRGLEMPPEWFAGPVYYRSNQRSFLGHGEEVWFPAGERMMDYELELAAVLGAELENPTPEQAAAAIAGYCLLNDWSARGIQREVMKVGLGPGRAKDFGTSAGPWLVTADEVGELGAVELAARVNGREWSRGSPGAMHWSWGQLLASAAAGVRFEPGDVFGSGTLPGGCGLEQDRFLEEGDVVELDGGELFGVLAGTVRRRAVSTGGSR